MLLVFVVFLPYMKLIKHASDGLVKITILALPVAQQQYCIIADSYVDVSREFALLYFKRKLAKGVELNRETTLAGTAASSCVDSRRVFFKLCVLHHFGVA